MCWYRNIMVHKCYCATKQIWHSKYTARNQTICFKRTQELLKLSWNISGEKAAATLISKAGWHCSPATRSPVVLSSLPVSHSNDASSEEENFLLLSPKLLQDDPEREKRNLQNWLDLTSYSLRTGVLSPGHITVPTLFLDCALMQNEIGA